MTARSQEWFEQRINGLLQDGFLELAAYTAEIYATVSGLEQDFPMDGQLSPAQDTGPRMDLAGDAVMEL